MSTCRTAILCLVLMVVASAPVVAQQTSTLPSASRSTFLKLTEVQELWEENRYDEAIAELDELATGIRDKPYDYALTRQYLAHTSVLAGDTPRARLALEEAMVIEGLPPQMEADLQLFYGQILVGDEEYEKALEMLEGWLAKTVTPALPAQIFYVAYANYMTGDLQRAQPLIERAINEDTVRHDSWDRLYYQILFEQKIYGEALAVLMEMINRKPGDDGYWRLLVNHYMQLEDSRAALTALAIAHLQNPMTEPADLKRLVSVYGYVEIPEKAARMLEEYLADEALPADPESLRQLGDLWLMARDRAKAKVALQRAASVAPDGRTYQLLGGIFFEDEEWGEAYKAFVEALRLGGLEETPRVHLLAGISAYRADMKPEARDSLETAAEDDELRPQAESLLRRL